MKIILSPSKTQHAHTSQNYPIKELLFPKEHKKVVAALRKLKKSDIQDIMKIKGDLLDQTYQSIKHYNTTEEFQAFDAFTGLVFFNMDRSSYHTTEYQYIEQHIRILDAFYGVLEPGTLIKPYRLDMKMNIGMNLYHFWNVTPYFTDEVIINLASTEFSKMIDSPYMITISFLQNKQGTFVNQATYSKQARGRFADFMIQNKIIDIQQLYTFRQDGYSYHSELSTDTNIVFTR